MINCDDLLDQLSRQTRRHVHLALMAEAPPVAAMHIDLALLSAEQTQAADQLFDES